MNFDFEISSQYMFFIGMLFNCKIIPYFYGYMRVFFLPNNPKNLDPSYKTDLDVWGCHRTDLVICCHSQEAKTLSYSQIK